VYEACEIPFASPSYMFDQADKARAYMQAQFDQYGCEREDATQTALLIVRERAKERDSCCAKNSKTFRPLSTSI
jgi:hypothetical protein